MSELLAGREGACSYTMSELLAGREGRSYTRTGEGGGGVREQHDCAAGRAKGAQLSC